MSVPTFHWIGRSIKRREDPRFLRGQARYVDDIVLPGMAFLVMVRSTHGHARLRKVAVEAARRAPGVVAVVTAQDLAGRLYPVPPNPLKDAQVAAVPDPILAAGTGRNAWQTVATVLAYRPAGVVVGTAVVEGGT